jgi:hypothetical protein
MFENYSNIYNDSNKYANYGVSQQEKKYLKKTKQQNKQNKYGLSSFSNSNTNNIGGLISNIEAFGGMNRPQFLENFQNQTMQSSETQSGLNFGSPAPNPYPSNPSNMQNVSIQQINSQIQSLNNQNKLQAYNPKNPSNNVTTYAKQSEAVLSQNQLTDDEIAQLVELTIQYNQLIKQYNTEQNNVMNNADNQVLSMNSTTNPYLGQNLEISGGQVYYITNAGIAQPYEISPIQVQNLPPPDSSLFNAYSNITNTPTTVNSTSAINATVYDSAGTNYINTTPAMQVGNTKYQWMSSGNEGTNVYANNSQPLSFTDSSFVGCYNTSISNGQQPLMSLAPGSTNNYTFQTCQQVAYDSGSPFFSFNVSSPSSQTGACYISNSQANINTMTTQCPAVNYTNTVLWSTNITPVSGSDMSSNYMSIDPAGNVVIYNSSNIAIWSSDNSDNSLAATNYVGCYQSSVTNPVTTDVTSQVKIYNTKPVCTDRAWWGGCKDGSYYEPGTYETGTKNVTNPVTTNETVQTMQDVTNSSNNTWESCYQYAYNGNYKYFGVSNFNPANGTSSCLVSNVQAGGGVPNSCSLQDQLYYGGNGSNAVYSATNAPLNAFLTLQDNGLVTAFTGTTLQDQQTVTWQLDMSGQTQMPNCQVYTDANYPHMQTGQWLYEGNILSSPSGTIWLTMEGGNLVLYTSSNTPKCYGMTTSQNQTYYAGDTSMNALYQNMGNAQPNYLGNIGYVDENSVLYQYPENLVGQGNTFTYMGNYDSSGIVLTNLPSGNSQVSIVNGNFSQPEIANNSFEYITSETQVPGWNFNAVLVNNSTAWGFPIPYPNGNQCVSLQGESSIAQTLNLTPGSYTLTFYAVGRDCCDGILVNPVIILLNGTQIYSFQPPIGTWTSYSTTFNVIKNGSNVITFKGTATDDQSTAIQNINISDNGNYSTGLDLSGAMQQCINTPNCNAFVMTNNSQGGSNLTTVTKFMQTAFGTPTYSQSSSNYLPRFPNPNAQLYLRNPTVNNSPYCNKSITGINSGLYSNYQTNGQMDSNMQCVQINTTDPLLQKLSGEINNLSSTIDKKQKELMKKTMTVNQQEKLNEIILGRQFKEIDTVEAVQKKFKQSVVNAQNIKNDSNITVLRENQSYTLWSVLAISIAMISIHVIR